MSRTVTSGVEELYKQQTSKAYIGMINFKDSVGAIIARVTDNSQAIVHNTNTYLPIAFQANIPKDSEGSNATATFTICNVDRTIMAAMRNLTGIPTMEYFIIRSDAPNTIEIGPWEYYLSNISFDAMAITFSLTYATYVDVNASRIKYNTTNFPGTAPR